MERNVPGGRELRRGAQGRACGTSWGTGDEVAEMSWGSLEVRRAHHHRPGVLLKPTWNIHENVIGPRSI